MPIDFRSLINLPCMANCPKRWDTTERATQVFDNEAACPNHLQDIVVKYLFKLGRGLYKINPFQTIFETAPDGFGVRQCAVQAEPLHNASVLFDDPPVSGAL
jgi:hypothetical protein